jgi:hypothetical protein
MLESGSFRNESVIACDSWQEARLQTEALTCFVVKQVVSPMVLLTLLLLVKAHSVESISRLACGIGHLRGD